MVEILMGPPGVALQGSRDCVITFIVSGVLRLALSQLFCPADAILEGLHLVHLGDGGSLSRESGNLNT